MKRRWHKGPPPHVGWWNASTRCDNDAWRWWDGKEWSFGAYSRASAAYAGEMAKIKVNPTKAHLVEWTDYYPENARVPRRAP